MNNDKIDTYRIKTKTAEFIQKVFFVTLVIGLTFIILHPILKLIPPVITKMDSLGDPDVVWIPKEFSLLSFEAGYAITYGSKITIIANTLFYALTIALIQTFMSAMAGFSLARVDFPGRGIVFALVVLTILIPSQALLIPQYLHFKQFDVFGIITAITGGTIDLINNPSILYVLAALGLGVKQGFFVFMFRQFFMTMPKELEEAAEIDGCGFYGTYFRIMLPNAKPPIMVVSVLSFVWNYSDTYFTNYFHPEGLYIAPTLMGRYDMSQTNITFINGLISTNFDVFTTSEMTYHAVRYASLMIMLAPLLVVYFIVQKNLVESSERSGIVG